MTTKHLMNLNLNPGQCESRMDSLNDSMFQGYADLINKISLSLIMCSWSNFISSQLAFPFLRTTPCLRLKEQPQCFAWNQANK